MNNKHNYKFKNNNNKMSNHKLIKLYNLKHLNSLNKMIFKPSKIYQKIKLLTQIKV